MKKRLVKEEGVDAYDHIVSVLKLPDTKGRMVATDCANAEGILRLVQSVRSPNAEPFKVWLARVGAMVMDIGEERLERARTRGELDRSDRELHELVEFHGITTPEQHAELTDANYAGLYNVACELDLLRRRHMLPGALPDTMGSLELAANTFQRALTAEMIRQRQVQGTTNVTKTAHEAGQAIRASIDQVGGPMPEDMPQYPPLPPGEWMPEDHPSRINWNAGADADDQGPPILLIELPKAE